MTPHATSRQEARRWLRHTLYPPRRRFDWLRFVVWSSVLLMCVGEAAAIVWLITLVDK